jgi:hypothetical protein
MTIPSSYKNNTWDKNFGTFTKASSYENNKYPLFAQLGFINAILEEEFDIAIATITDIGFLGFSPKLITKIY